ncbi:MAG: hypothetical protein KC635_08040 [Myxococcales bacterium]|nr:hypothetical protein [Myxococcales bacterium]
MFQTPDTLTSDTSEPAPDSLIGADTRHDDTHASATCPTDCRELDGPCRRGVCDAGTCVTEDTTGPCDDGLACTHDDACVDGACVGETVTCDDGVDCTVEACREEDDGCVIVSDSCDCESDADCQVGDLCDGHETCDDQRHCQAGEPVVCSPSTEPCRENTCAPETGVCRLVAAREGEDCDDGLVCTTDDVCAAGVCRGATVSCDDGLACTNDSCVEPTGCQNTLRPARCLIDGVCHTEGDVATGLGGCGVCAPTVATTAWAARGGTNHWPLLEGYWAGARDAHTLTSYCNPVVVACHNCYVQSTSQAQSLSLTRARILDAIQTGSDAIELDVSDEGGVLRVNHGDDGSVTGARLDEVLAAPEWALGRQVVLLESKELTPTTTYALALLDQLHAAGFLDGSRRVVIRAFVGELAALRLIADSAAEDPRLGAADLRFHVLIGAGDAPTTLVAQSIIDGAVSDGFDGVELEYTQRDLLSRLAYARAKGLATGVWTVPVFLGEPIQAGLQDLVDLVVTDMPPALANAVATDVNGLIHLDVTAVAANATAISYLRRALTPVTASVGIANAPLLLSGSPFYGSSMGFEASASRALTTWDADHDPGDGYLVMANVSFAQLALSDFETQVIVGKADAGGFSLELANAADGVGTVLRFGVHVNGTYVYASRPANTLSTERAYFVVGAYDGSGGVRLLVDGSDANVVIASTTGQVTQNDSPVVIGADPQGVTTRRWWLSGRVQVVHVASWPQF